MIKWLSRIFLKQDNQRKCTNCWYVRADNHDKVYRCEKDWEIVELTKKSSLVDVIIKSPCDKFITPNNHKKKMSLRRK